MSSEKELPKSEPYRNNTIWKFPVPLPIGGDEVAIEVPKRAQFLTLQLQNGSPCVWYEVNKGETEKTTVNFRWVGTGHPFEDMLNYVYKGTVILQSLQLVFHLYEDLRRHD